MSSSDKICYLCGKTQGELAEPLTHDHVIADGFFPNPKPKNLLTLPCCVPCQKEYRMDEEYVRNAFAPISNVTGNAAAMQAWKKTHRSIKRRPAMYADFAQRIFPVAVGGAKRLALGFSRERTIKVIRKIILGLHYHLTKKRLPSDIPMEVFFQPDKTLEEYSKHWRYVGYFGDTFSFSAAFVAEGDSLWWLTFYQSIVVIVAVGTTAEDKKLASES